METSEREVPRYVLEDLLFERRLARNLNSEQEKLNALLAEHIRLLQERRAFMAEVNEAVQQRWKGEEEAASNLHPVPMTEEDADAD
jgi:ABC-type multidrug transport system fused ATPase/permease subunit